VRLSRSPGRTPASFNDPSLVSHGGLVPVMAVAERAGLPELQAEHVRPGRRVRGERAGGGRLLGCGHGGRR